MWLAKGLEVTLSQASRKQIHGFFTAARMKIMPQCTRTDAAQILRRVVGWELGTKRWERRNYRARRLRVAMGFKTPTTRKGGRSFTYWVCGRPMHNAGIGMHLHRYTSVWVYICIGTHLCRYASVSVHICIGIHMHRYTSVSVCICVGMHLCRYTSASAYICIGTHLDRCTSA